MKSKLLMSVLVISLLLIAIAWVYAQPASGDPIVEGFKITEVASVADAYEQLYGEKNYMYHDMRPLFPTKFAGPAFTVYMKQEENKEGGAAVQGMLEAIDKAPAGSIYVMVLENGLDYGGLGGLMATAMKYRNLGGAIIDASIRDTPQMRRILFPVFSRGIAPSTTVGHYRFVGMNIPVTCAGVKVDANDIIVADEDGVCVVPRARAAETLKRAQQLDLAEHTTLALIERFKSILKAVAQQGRI
jgi:4-hydroxy-4-methyl-2-oxoglutarate aldolase